MPDDPEDPDEEDGPPGDRHGRLVQSEPIEGEQDQGRQGQGEDEKDLEGHGGMFVCWGFRRQWVGRGPPPLLWAVFQPGSRPRRPESPKHQLDPIVTRRKPHLPPILDIEIRRVVQRPQHRLVARPRKC